MALAGAGMSPRTLSAARSVRVSSDERGPRSREAGGLRGCARGTIREGRMWPLLKRQGGGVRLAEREWRNNVELDG